MSEPGFAEAGADRFTEWLRAESEPAWREVVNHRFVSELGNDTLLDEVFRRYLVQDYAFLDAGVRLMGYAVGQAPTREARSRLVAFLGTLTGDENDYFERSFDALGVPHDEYVDPTLTPTTASFVDLIGRACREGGYEESLAVLVPAEWAYLAWAGSIEESPERGYLDEWVGLHDNPDFEGYVGWLRGELDGYGPNLSPRRQRRVRRLFRRTVEFEASFFDAAFDP